MPICWKGLLKCTVCSETKPENVFFGDSFSPLDASACPGFGSQSHSGGVEVKGNLRLQGVKGWTETTDMDDLAA